MRKQDKYSVDSFTRKYQNECMRMAMSIIKDKEIAEDVVQDFLMKLVMIENEEGSIERIYYNGVPNKVFMYRSLMNRYIDKWRKRKNGPSITYMDELPEDATPAWGGIDFYENETKPLEDALAESKAYLYEIIEIILEEVHWYDARVYRLKHGLAPYDDDGPKSFRDLAKLTGISSTSLWNTCRKVNERIREAVPEELYERYLQDKEQLNQYI